MVTPVRTGALWAITPSRPTSRLDQLTNETKPEGYLGTKVNPFWPDSCYLKPDGDFDAKTGKYRRVTLFALRNHLCNWYVF